jgi:FdhD protein
MNSSNQAFSIMSNTTHTPLDLPQAGLKETPVAICINGISQAVMMASPSNLEDFALGFVVSEGLLESIQGVIGVDVEYHPEGISLNIEVTAAQERNVKTRRRLMAGPSGCGLCGLDSLKTATELGIKPGVYTPFALPKRDSLYAAKAVLNQTMLGSSGYHRAALFNLNGELQWVREDVGRHSALDKLLGAMLQTDIPLDDTFIMLTSRCSHDLVAKLIRAFPLPLVTLSQPTTMAVTSARSVELPLFCFVQKSLKRFA